MRTTNALDDDDAGDCECTSFMDDDDTCMAVVTLPHDEVSWKNMEVCMEQRVRSIDDTVIRPQNLVKLNGVR